MALNIYQYYSAQKYIRDCFAEKKVKNSSFSVRAWAQRLGLKSHTPLHAVIKGERKTPLSIYVPLSEDLHLSPEEAHYLLIMINIENSKDQYSRLMLLDKLETFKKHKRFKMAEFADFSLLSDPFWGLLIEMTDQIDFKNDTAWIHEHSRIPKSSQEIKKIIATLLEKNILKIEDGRLKKTNEHITNVHDLANIGSQKYHKNSSLLAAEQVELQAVNEREFNGYAMNIKTKDLMKMKQAIRTFMKEFILEFEAKAQEGDATYQFGTHLFSLTRKS
ncbi:MAG: TIGR02147 family protein [Pseudobdellovibrionaceae bacterium]